MMLCAGKTGSIDSIYYELCQSSVSHLCQHFTKVNHPIQRSPFSMKQSKKLESFSLKCCIRSCKQNQQESKGSECLIEFFTSIISKLASYKRQQVVAYLDRLFSLSLDRHISVFNICITRRENKYVNSFSNLN